MSTTKNGRRKKAIEHNKNAMLHHTDKTKRDACAILNGKIIDKMAKKGDWKFKSEKAPKAQTVAAPKRDGKKPKGGKGKE